MRCGLHLCMAQKLASAGFFMSNPTQQLHGAHEFFGVWGRAPIILWMVHPTYTWQGVWSDHPV